MKHLAFTAVVALLFCLPASLAGTRGTDKLGRELNGSVVGIFGLAPTAHTLAPMLREGASADAERTSPACRGDGTLRAPHQVRRRMEPPR